MTPERVVDAAGRLADEAGLAAVTLSAVAAGLGVRTPSLYNHVAGLDDLRIRLARRAIAELGERMTRAAVGRSGDDAVWALGRAYRGFARDHPGRYAATVTASDDPEARALAAGVVETVVAVLSAYDLEADEAIHATRVLRSALHGFVALEAVGGFGLPQDVEVSFTKLLEVVVAGLRARA